MALPITPPPMIATSQDCMIRPDHLAKLGSATPRTPGSQANRLPESGASLSCWRR